MKVTNAQSVSTTYRVNRHCNRSISANNRRVGRLIYSMLLMGVLFVLPTASIAAQEGLEYETIRFYTKNSRPERLLSSAMSPNGQYLALSFQDNLGARSGASIVDLRNKRLVKEVGRYSFFALAFSGNSQQLLGTGNYAGTQLIQVASGTAHEYRNPPYASGKIGMDLGEENGKLLVTRLNEGFNPTIDDQIRVGDEVLAVNEGAKPTLYNDSREWKSLTGKSRSKALDMMAGKPGTWVQLRLQRRGSSTPVDVSIQRQWTSNSQRQFPKNGNSLTIATVRNAFVFRSADTMRPSAYISLRDIRTAGQHVVSPDGKRFAALSQVVGGSRFFLEVHSLESGKLERSSELDTNNYRHVCFSPDSNQVLVGTRDTIEIYDIASDEWQKPVVMTSSEDADSGRVVTRRIPLGFGFPGDLYTTSRSVVYSKPAAVSQFAVARNGTIAIASENGEIVLASMESKERIGLVGDNILGAKPELIEFTPTGEHLVAFAKGVLHIVDIKPEQPSVASANQK